MAHEGTRQERQVRDRGVTKSKAEKARPPTVLVPQVDIVPGRLTEAEWMALAAIEEGEDVVGDILADLLAQVMAAAFKVYLTQQCIPFTVSQAREAMLQMIQWRFLVRDEGESAVDDDPSWCADPEPVACPADSWAQGCVPVLRPPIPAEHPTCGPESPAPVPRSPRSPARPRTPLPLAPLPPGRRLPGPHPGALPQDPGLVDRSRLKRFWIGRGSNVQTGSREPSLGPGAGPGPQPSPAAFGEAGSQGLPADDHRQRGGSVSSAGHLGARVRPSVRTAPPGGPEAARKSVLEDPWWAVAEAGQTFSPQLSFGDLYYCVSPFRWAGDPAELAAKSSSPCCSWADAHPPLSTWASLRGPQPPPPPPPPPQQQPGSPDRPLAGGRLQGSVRPDPQHLPRRWVRPLAEVVAPDSLVRPLHSYRRRPRGRQTQAGAAPCAPDPCDGVSPAEPGVPFPDLGPCFGLQLPPSGFSPAFGSKAPFPSSGVRFLDTHPVPPDVARSSSPKPWPGAKWPRGWEGEAQLLGDLWAGRSRVPSLDLEREGQDSPRWPHLAPQVLEPTSQVMWKPVLQPDALKLAPGVSLWIPSTRTLLRSSEPQPAGKDRCTPTEQSPIRTEAPKSLLIGSQLLKNIIPKGCSPPVKYLPSSET